MTANTSSDTYKSRKGILIIRIIVLVFVLLVCFAGYLQFFNKRIYLYAWETPQDFSFLRDYKYFNKKIGVAYLSGEIVLRDTGVVFTDRRNPLIIPNGVEAISVIRISNFTSAEELTNNKEKIRDFIISRCAEENSCQIDIDAKPSEYSYYENLIREIKQKLPEAEISITALASWCGKDSWINNLQIDYAVPMLYRMGSDEAFIKKGHPGDWFLANSLCKNNVALSIDEIDFDFSKYTNNKNIFIFNPGPWNKQGLDDILKILNKRSNL